MEVSRLILQKEKLEKKNPLNRFGESKVFADLTKNIIFNPQLKFSYDFYQDLHKFSGSTAWWSLIDKLNEAVSS